MRILVVDDDPAIRDLLSTLVAEAGHQSVTGENGQDAFRRLLREEFDAVFLDILMPEWNGIEALRGLQLVAGRPPRIVICTGHASDEFRTEMAEFPLFDWVDKPFDNDRIFDILARLAAG